MSQAEEHLLEGRCTCGCLRYRVRGKPIFVHCCHCHWCQRETGSAFAVNALFESDRVELLQGEIDTVVTPSSSGKGQKIVRCPRCRSTTPPGTTGRPRASSDSGPRITCRTELCSGIRPYGPEQSSVLQLPVRHREGIAVLQPPALQALVEPAHALL
ncbi:MAG: hypothetical protein EHM68_03950 [Lysobacterales bacterium]|nr:MAG: hypothetical protein EHM68_03950 [Xanthomonadales bacterium]